MNGIRSVVVVGAGVSGLTVAFFLHRAGVRVTILERSTAPGGTMQTFDDGGWLVEMGPNSALETTPLFAELFEHLGILNERLYADPRSDKRYILRNGALHPLPMSAASFLVSPLWSLSGKIRLLKEPFVGRAVREETIAEFVERRLGREFLDYAINPFVAGVYAGAPEQLSVRAAFPKLYALEEKYGGLIRGMIGGARKRKERAEKSKDRAKMFSFRRGMQTLTSALAAALREEVRYSCDATAVYPNRDPHAAGRFQVRFLEKGVPSELTADAVILALPAYAAESLIRLFAPAVADGLKNVYYPPVAEIFLGYTQEAMTRPLDGFGYLIPAKEHRKILGTIWSSSLFPERAPRGHVALTTFLGGARQPELVSMDDDDIVRTVAGELRTIMGVKGDPLYARVIRWERAIPQYNVGYLGLINEIERLEESSEGLYFCNNFRGGIAVGDCVMSAERIALRILGKPPAASG